MCQAFYLPWAYVMLALLMGQSPVIHLMGIAAGHLYVFLDKIVPIQYNRTVVWTPAFLCAASSLSFRLICASPHNPCQTRWWWFLCSLSPSAGALALGRHSLYGTPPPGVRPQDAARQTWNGGYNWGGGGNTLGSG